MTFGFGVGTEDTWPKALEEHLRTQGVDVEVANLGRPGADPRDYAAIAGRAVPLLRPDLVIVALSHGDDLSQIMTDRAPGEGVAAHVAWQTLKDTIKAMYPQLSTRVAAAREINATAGWKGDVANLLSRLDPQKRRHFEVMDHEIKAMFVEGQLNPAMLSGALLDPFFMKKTLNLESPQVKEGIEIISGNLATINVRAQKFGGAAVAVSLPNGWFVSQLIQESYARMGYIVEQDYLSTTAMDEALRMAAARAELDFFGVTERFREEARQRNLFYQFDGHYNGDGQHFFAKSIAPFIAKKLAELPRG